MKKRNFHKANIALKIREQILKMAPYANEVDIKVDEDKDGEYESTIKVHIPPKKSLIAIKKDECFRSSLEKSRQAILKQVKKIKEKRKKRKQYHLKLNQVKYI